MRQQFVGTEHPESVISWAEVERRHCSGDEPDISTVDLLIVIDPAGNGNDFATVVCSIDVDCVFHCTADDAPFKMVDAEVTSVRLVITELEESYAINKLVTQKVKVPAAVTKTSPFVLLFSLR